MRVDGDDKRFPGSMSWIIVFMFALACVPLLPHLPSQTAVILEKTQGREQAARSFGAGTRKHQYSS